MLPEIHAVDTLPIIQRFEKDIENQTKQMNYWIEKGGKEELK